MKKITIFTPTFNRAHKLPNLYNSLLHQTSKDFIWLIIDDGSTDITRNLIASWIKENKIIIKYVYQPNRGKMQAMNKSYQYLETDLFFCVDSDDYLLDDSIEIILGYYSTIMNNPLIAGLIAYKVDTKLNILGNQCFPSNILETNLEQLNKKGITVDLSIIFKSSIIKQYTFPNTYDEKFMPENYIYSRLDLKYKYILSYNKITVCEYLEDGYSNNTLKLLKYNKNNYRLYWALKASNEQNYKKKILYFIRYDEFCLHSKKIGLNDLNDNDIFFTFNDYLLLLILFPIGIIYYFIRMLKWKNL